MEYTSSVDRPVSIETRNPIESLLTISGALDRVAGYPRLRFMGSKYKLVSWIAEILQKLDFDTVLDAFSGSGVVAYYFKSLGKTVVSNDFLNFTFENSRALIENGSEKVTSIDVEKLLTPVGANSHFIRRTFEGVFYSPADLDFLDNVAQNIQRLCGSYKKSLAVAALTRACLKKQPRGVFTVANTGVRYDDGRRDLRLSLQEHFLEQIEVYNSAVFDNGRRNMAVRSSVFELSPSIYENMDLVYLDPPYVPRADDNDYIKRYHFVEGLSNYWSEDAVMSASKVKKLPKRYTPFAYRRSALDAFDRMFRMFQRSIVVLSYSSNGYPDLDDLLAILRRYKHQTEVFSKDHRYHFGTHSAVRRSVVEEFLIVGR